MVVIVMDEHLRRDLNVVLCLERRAEMIYSGLKLMGRLFMVDCRQRLWLKWFRVESVIVMGGRALSFISLPPTPLFLSPPPLNPLSRPHTRTWSCFLVMSCD